MPRLQTTFRRISTPDPADRALLTMARLREAFLILVVAGVSVFLVLSPSAPDEGWVAWLPLAAGAFGAAGDWLLERHRRRAIERWATVNGGREADVMESEPTLTATVPPTAYRVARSSGWLMIVFCVAFAPFLLIIGLVGVIGDGPSSAVPVAAASFGAMVMLFSVGTGVYLVRKRLPPVRVERGVLHVGRRSVRIDEETDVRIARFFLPRPGLEAGSPLVVRRGQERVSIPFQSYVSSALAADDSRRLFRWLFSRIEDVKVREHWLGEVPAPLVHELPDFARAQPLPIGGFFWMLGIYGASTLGIELLEAIRVFSGTARIILAG